MTTNEMNQAPLRILVGAAVPPDPNSGAAGTVYQMNQALKRLGHEVDEIWQTDLGRRIQHGNLHYLLELPRAYRREMRKRIQQKSYDVIELNQPHAYLAAIEHQRRQSPGVFVNRSHGHEVRSEETLDFWREKLNVGQRAWWKRLLSWPLWQWHRANWQRIAKAADGFVVSCREDAEFLEKRYQVPRERIGEITQGLSKAYLETPLPSNDPQRWQRLLYVAQFSFFKAPMMMAEAVNRLLAANRDAEMTWVCQAEAHDDVRKLLRPEIQNRVRLLAWMPQDALIAEYDRHGLFLFSSFFEGFGKTPLEAMSRGLCVISTSTGGMRDYIIPDRNGVLVPVGEVDKMVEQAGRFLQNPARAGELGAAARQTALQHTWDRCARDAVTFYRFLLERKQQLHDRDR